MAVHRKRITKKYSKKSKAKLYKKSKTKTHSKNKNKHNSRRQNKTHKQRGGFAADCNLASIKEPGFNIAGLGDIAGLSIPESRAAIFRPNCKADTYQAMTP
jgi:hypothetical protein